MILAFVGTVFDLIDKTMIMGFLKAFTLGLMTAYGVYFITRKGPDGRSVLDDMLDKPDEFLKAAKGQLLEDTAVVVKDIIK